MHPTPFSLSRFFRPYPSHCPLPTDHGFPLAHACRRIYRAAMRSAVNRVPAETDCPGRCLGKTGGRFVSRGSRLTWLDSRGLGVWDGIETDRPHDNIKNRPLYVDFN